MRADPIFPRVLRLFHLNTAFPQIYLMKRNYKRNSRITGLILFISTLAINTIAQSNLAKEKEFIERSGDRLFFITLFIILAVLGGVYYFWRRSRKGMEQPQHIYDRRYTSYNGNDSFEMGHVDAEKEIEWLQKARKTTAKGQKPSYGTKRRNSTKNRAGARKLVRGSEGPSVDTKVFQEKMKMLQYAQLPINSFNELRPAKHFEPLPESKVKSLLSAIKQADGEFEEDASVRELAINVLAAFKNCNSVDALSQIALYDLSSSLRSKAVSVLTDFDHESVFETILLACADPTREVRAAAARGLFRLNFDRAGAWRRIIETGDEFRMSQAVRAAIESSIVSKSFDRLVHEDLKIAYEAFTLAALMIKSGEEKEIFEAIRNHKDERVKFALLHVIKAIGDERSLAGLNDLRQDDLCSAAVFARIDDVIKIFEQVAVPS